MDQVFDLSSELNVLGGENPMLIAMGNVVFDAFSKPGVLDELRTKLGSDTRIVKVTHYSKPAGIRHHDYVARVYGELKHHGIM